jgi:predicted ATPase/transcriptional regulator with XRE-family HTH domain
VTTSRTSTLGARLKQYRMAAGLTQEELAERARLSVRAIGDLERGVRQAPHKDTLALLIEALGLSDADSTVLQEAARQSRRPDSTILPATTSSGTLPSGRYGPLTLLIGREREGAAIAHLLTRGDTRLLTLTGPAGIGKTRLAQQMAMDLSGTFADGIVFVSLVAVGEHTLVIPAISQALGLREEVGPPLLNQIQSYLAGRELLLVLDNFEHVVGAAPDIAAVLAACPKVKMLVTSRTTLRVRGEQQFVVPPLDTPDLAHLPALEDLAQYAAVALFVRRVHDVRPTFTLTPEIAPIIAAITVRLDGLPLAIELAAARIKVLSPEALLARLDASLSLLTRGSIDLPERQQTMRRAIAWSYDLLSEHERRLLRRLAVFVGGWTLEAAEAICDDSHGQGPTILDRLAGLVDKSLVVPGEDGDGEPRFRLLELIREYALEQLVASGEEAAVRQRHSEFYLAFSESAERYLRGNSQTIWFDRLEEEHANLRAALVWAQESGTLDLGLRLATSLWWFWQVRGHMREGRTWLEKLLSMESCADEEKEMGLRAEALRAAGNLAWCQAEYDLAAEFLKDSLTLNRRVGNTNGEAHALDTLGLVADERGDWDLAVTLFEEALALFRAAQDKNNVAMVYNNLAVVADRRQQYASAVELYEKSLELNREVGDRRSIALTLNNLGEALRAQGDLQRAAALMEDSLALYQELGDKDGMSGALNNLGDVLHEQGDLKRAIGLYRRGITIAHEIGVKWSLLSLLEGAAHLAYDLGLVTGAARLFALATELCTNVQMSRSIGGQADYDSNVARVRAQLGEEAFAAEWEAGRSMTAVEAETLVAELDSFASNRPESGRAEPLEPGDHRLSYTAARYQKDQDEPA